METKFSSNEVRQIHREIFKKMFGFNSADLMLQGHYRLTESELLHVREFVKKLQNDVPLQYVIGHTEFCELKILCDERALIPRPETEELVWKILDLFQANHPAPKILDICTGTGCIALALKNKLEKAVVFALDLSSDALNLAQKNADELEIDVSFMHGDALNLSESTTLTQEKWTVIVSNPPYIPHSEKSTMANNVLNFEPHIALFVDGLDPLIFYKQIAIFAIENLEEHGVLAFELHENLASQTAEICSHLGFSSVEIFEDLQGKQRMLLARI